MRRTGEILIPARRSEVYAVLADPTRLSPESPNRAELLSDEELEDGTRVVHSRRQIRGGVAIDSRCVYTERVQEERIRFRTTAEPLVKSAKGRWGFGRVELESTITLEARPDGTFLRREDEIRFRPILLHPFFALLMRATNRHPAQSALERLLTELARPPCGPSTDMPPGSDRRFPPG